CSAYADSNVFF
nr:immunoglobulin light chain junction region [Macaca mulatta]MPO10062.1 immunoglobulin light chain junction region [Macaca mulatta]